VAHFLLKYTRKGKRPTDACELVRIESICAQGAQDKADEAADARGGGRSVLQLFNERGLVSTRSSEGRWSS